MQQNGETDMDMNEECTLQRDERQESLSSTDREDLNDKEDLKK